MIYIKPYNTWKKRKILVYNFEQHNAIGRNAIEDSLREMFIPVVAYNFFDDNSMAWKKDHEELIGIIFSGSHSAVDSPFSPYVPDEILNNDLPKLGICYGHELLGKLMGVEIVPCNYDVGDRMDCVAELSTDCMLFDGLKNKEIVSMRHNNMLKSLPKTARLIAKTNLTPIGGFEMLDNKIWGLQFHPEKNYMHVIFNNFAKYCYKLFHPEAQ